VEWAECVFVQNRFLRRARLGDDGFGLAVHECIQLGIQAFDAIKMSARDIHRRNFSASDLRRDFVRRKNGI
jgi:hypothetical protein